ncbi:MAG: MBL fold metallo-hydrolase [Clostridiales bacterium]|jgi:phosphoribosyl 1,2-cyclic phosphodiesterase|nr:MBL fold metallo-hydrolase [Clostridiales bacterium]
MAITFCPVASGSSGNCIYLSCGETKILIDAGLSGKRIEEGLNSFNRSCAEIDALFITHEHSDHIKGAGILSRRYDLPVFATEGTWAALDRYKFIGDVSPKNRRYIYREENFYLNDICIHPFAVPHDAADPVGYAVLGGGYKAVVATDIGHVSDDVINNIQDADILLLESNHDVDMVKNGRYPYPLKKRILGNHGHLSNVTAGELLKDNITAQLKHVFLGHLSSENNSPALAYETVFNILLANDIPVNKKFHLHLAERDKTGRLLKL